MDRAASPDRGGPGPPDGGDRDVPPARRARDAELAREGWERRFTGGPPRLREAVELYESLGLEVRLDELVPRELGPECTDCTLALSLFRVIYTRRAGAD